VGGVCNIFVAFGLFGEDEVLMNGEHRQGEAAFKGHSFQLGNVGRRLVHHLPVEDFDSIKPNVCSVLDDFLDTVPFCPKMPE
jgi:hypothetical protein